MKRKEEVVVPSWPLLFTNTAEPLELVDPLMPAMNAEVWVPLVPMRMAPLSPEVPWAPIAMLLLAPPVSPNPAFGDVMGYFSSITPTAAGAQDHPTDRRRVDDADVDGRTHIMILPDRCWARTSELITCKLI